jgi:SAM-dependent methyltransferase
MSNHEVYFENHDRALRFPWSIYHRPLMNDLESFLVNNLRKDLKVLIVGPGYFQEFFLLKTFEIEISILDIDPRVLKINNARHGPGIKNCFLVDKNLNGYPEDESFDLIYAKEVIEHLENYGEFLKKLYRVLRLNGKLWLSTPNYGFFLLPTLEKTFLELIAKFSGFSRKDIHPSRFDKNLLQASVSEAGFQDIEIKEMLLKLALTVTALKK